jgi:hypothetical protein
MSKVYIVGVTGEEVNADFKNKNSFERTGINEFQVKPIRSQFLEQLVAKVFQTD